MVGKADITPFEPDAPAAPSKLIGMMTVFVFAATKLDPLTVSVTVIFVSELSGVIVNVEDVVLPVVAPVTDQLYVGDVIPVVTAVNVQLVGVYAPPALFLNPVNPEISIY